MKRMKRSTRLLGAVLLGIFILLSLGILGSRLCFNEKFSRYSLEWAEKYPPSD